MKMDPLHHLKQHVITHSRIKNPESNLDINFKASFSNLKKDYRAHVTNLERIHAKVQTEKTHNETLWTSIKKSVKFMKIFFNSSENIDRQHQDFQQMTKIEKEISKLEYSKLNEISLLLLNSGLNGLSDQFDLLDHNRESVMSLYRINEELDSIATRNALDFDPEINALATQALKLKKRINAELNAIDEVLKRDARKYEQLESLEDVPLDDNIGNDLKGLALLFGMRRELNRLVKDFSKESVKNNEFQERCQKVKTSIDKKIDQADIRLKKRLFESTIVNFCRKVYEDDGYSIQMKRAFQKKLTQITNKKEKLIAILNPNNEIDEKNVRNYVNAVCGHLNTITNVLINVYNAGRESLNTVHDNELPIRKLFAGAELNKLKRCLKESIEYSNELTHYTILYEQSVQQDFQHIFLLPTLKMEIPKKEFMNNYEILFPYFEEIELLINLCQEEDVNVEKIELAKLKIQSIMDYLRKSLILINAKNVNDEFDEADKALVFADHHSTSQTILDNLRQNRNIKLENIKVLPKIQSKILMIKDEILKLNYYLDEHYPGLQVIEGSFRKPLITHINNMLFRGSVVSRSPEELQQLFHAFENYLDKLDHLRQSSNATSGILKGISVKDPIPNTKHHYLHGTAW